MMSVVRDFYGAFGFNLTPRLSVREPSQPDKYLGDTALWEQAETELAEALSEAGYEVTRDEGEAAFYGPKIDFTAEDSLKRTWQLATIQLDFNQPQRFNLTYTDDTGAKQTPVMIHRAILGSFERFMAILLEHYNGALPLWLAPVQVLVLPISSEQADYAHQVQTQLTEAGLRAEVDEGNDSIGKKIREATKLKVPVMLVVGKQEMADTTVSVRRFGTTQAETGESLIMPLKRITMDLQQEIAHKG